MILEASAGMNEIALGAFKEGCRENEALVKIDKMYQEVGREIEEMNISEGKEIF